MKCRSTQAAAAEFDQSVDYLIEQAPHVPKRFSESIDKAIEEIIEHPYSTQPTEKAGIFRKYVRAFPYSIFCTVDGA
ncbi:MAG: type II toxin-antitoxin system RelE/ParE family toxin, partial [Bradyrhizobium sp.]|nr:type II toxin-antitoxin system RelE/ParE family toxin [Bradyrhizobium sp.]